MAILFQLFQKRNEPKKVARRILDRGRNTHLFPLNVALRVNAIALESQVPSLASFNENKQAAQRGGKVAGYARKETEKELGRSIVSDESFLTNQLTIKQGKSLEGGGK